MKQLIVLALLVCVPVLQAQAAEPKAEPATVDHWLELQRSGQMASPYRQTASADERERSLRRWLNSLDYPIPEFYGASQQGTGGD